MIQETDEEPGESFIGFSNMQIIVFVVLAIIFMIIARDWEPVKIPQNLFWVLVIVFIIVSGALPYWVSKYRMPQVNVDGCHASFQHNDSPIPVADYYLRKKEDKAEKIKFNWLIYRKGASLFPVPTRGNDGVLIVPDFQMDTRGKNHRGNTQVFPTPLIQLPQALYNFYLNHPDDYNWNKIDFGYHDRQFIPKEFDDADKDLMIKQLDEQNNKKSKMLSGDYSEYQKIHNMVKKMTEPTMWDKITNLFQRSPNANQPQS